MILIKTVALTYLTDEETKVHRGEMTIMRSPPQLRGRADTNSSLLIQAKGITFPTTSHLTFQDDAKPAKRRNIWSH